MQTYCRQSYRWDRRSGRRPVRPVVPPDYAGRVRRVRVALGCTLAALAARIGAANKAVVYQWEARKRIPSPVFWRKVVQLERCAVPRTRALANEPATTRDALVGPTRRDV